MRRDIEMLKVCPNRTPSRRPAALAKVAHASTALAAQAAPAALAALAPAALAPRQVTDQTVLLNAGVSIPSSRNLHDQAHALEVVQDQWLEQRGGGQSMGRWLGA